MRKTFVAVYRHLPIYRYLIFTYVNLAHICCLSFAKQSQVDNQKITPNEFMGYSVANDFMVA